MNKASCNAMTTVCHWFYRVSGCVVLVQIPLGMYILNTFGLTLDASIRLEIVYLLLNGLRMIDCRLDGYSFLYSRAIFRNKPICPLMTTICIYTPSIAPL
eukprot:209294_1